VIGVKELQALTSHGVAGKTRRTDFFQSSAITHWILAAEEATCGPMQRFIPVNGHL